MLTKPLLNENICSFVGIGHHEEHNKLNELLTMLRSIFSASEVNIEEVKQLMANYDSNPNDWIKFARFDPTRYTRNLVDIGNGKYNLMILCWPQKISSKIHNHSDSHCIMKNLSGTLYEVRYQWPKKCDQLTLQDAAQMEKISEIRLDSENSVAYINDSIGLHRVENRDEHSYAVSLHLYCPPFSQCQTFDEQTGANQVVSMTFDNQPQIQQQYKVTRRKVSASCGDTVNSTESHNSACVKMKEMLCFEQSVK